MSFLQQILSEEYRLFLDYSQYIRRELSKGSRYLELTIFSDECIFHTKEVHDNHISIFWFLEEPMGSRNGTRNSEKLWFGAKGTKRR